MADTPRQIQILDPRLDNRSKYHWLGKPVGTDRAHAKVDVKPEADDKLNQKQALVFKFYVAGSMCWAPAHLIVN